MTTPTTAKRSKRIRVFAGPNGSGKTTIFEYVMSHESKIEFMRQASSDGYKCYLYYICTESPLINKSRVEARVKRGGHAVPPEKVESRYQRSLALLGDAVAEAYRAFLFDNSAKPDTDIAASYYLEYERGKLKHQRQDAPLPQWMSKHAPGIE